jgi:predicted anti-sigma-YlaC factor YlaD
MEEEPMEVDRHESIRHTIDKSLAGAASREEEHALREHLAACAACEEYLDASRRAIAGLGGFSFEVNPALDAKVLAALSLEAGVAQRTRPIPMGWSRLAALVLTVTGSLAASRFAGPAAAVFHMEPAQMHAGLVVLWIAPSVGFCLLFLLLSASPASWMNTKGLSL